MGDTLDTLITKIDANTNALATAIMKLHADLVAAQAAPTQAQLDHLAAIATHLEALCATQADPVPPVPPAITAPALPAAGNPSGETQGTAPGSSTPAA